MLNYEIKVKGTIVPKQRPRATTIGGFARMYTPSKTKIYEERIANQWIQDTNNFVFDEDKLLHVQIFARFTVPKSMSAKNKAEVFFGKRLAPTAKDCDNIAKVVLDALNGVAYKDDKQVVSLDVHKLYTTEEEYIQIFIQDYDKKIDMLNNPITDIEKYVSLLKRAKHYLSKQRRTDKDTYTLNECYEDLDNLVKPEYKYPKHNELLVNTLITKILKN